MASRTASGVDLGTVKKVRSAAAKGSHYKARTKQWLEKQGYSVGHLERMMWIRAGQPCGVCAQPKMFATKKDQFGADLLAVRADMPVTFVQVKLNRHDIAAAVRIFGEFPFPTTARRWVVVWEKGAREPEVIDAATYVIAARPRSVAPQETLF